MNQSPRFSNSKLFLAWLVLTLTFTLLITKFSSSITQDDASTIVESNGSVIPLVDEIAGQSTQGQGFVMNLSGRDINFSIVINTSFPNMCPDIERNDTLIIELYALTKITNESYQLLDKFKYKFLDYNKTNITVHLGGSCGSENFDILNSQMPGVEAPAAPQRAPGPAPTIDAYLLVVTLYDPIDLDFSDNQQKFFLYAR